MVEVKDGLVEQALAKAVLEKSSQELRDALLAEVWERHRETLEAQALETVRREHQRELASLKEHLRDEAAKERRALRTELELELERRYRQQEHELDLEMAARLARRRAARETARQERDRAERLLLALVKQVLSPQAKRYLADAGVTELDVFTVNQVLAKFGVRVRCEPRPTSARQVQVRLKEDGSLVPRAAFWWEECAPTTAPVIFDDDEEDVAAEAPTETTPRPA